MKTVNSKYAELSFVNDKSQSPWQWVKDKHLFPLWSRQRRLYFYEKKEQKYSTSNLNVLRSSLMSKLNCINSHNCSFSMCPVFWKLGKFHGCTFHFDQFGYRSCQFISSCRMNIEVIWVEIWIPECKQIESIEKVVYSNILLIQRQYTI